MRRTYANTIIKRIIWECFELKIKALTITNCLLQAKTVQH
jgi:hypothetical protein